MPRTVLKTNAKKRARAAALTISEPKKKETAARALARSGHGIAELAQDLADAKALCTMLANVEGPAERARDELQDPGSDEHTACSKAVNDFESVGRRAYCMADGLARLILTMEPRTPSETLSLALILAEELDVFISNSTDHKDLTVMNKWHRLEHALQAVIRGLVHAAEASSPLMDAYSTKEDLRPWAEARADAARQAAPYLARYANGRLTKAEPTSPI